MIGDGVRGGVARSQLHTQRLAGGVSCAIDRMEPEAALVVRGGAVLVLRVDLVQRRVDIQHHLAAADGRRRACPHLGPHRRHRRPQRPAGRRAEFVENPVQGRVRRHRPEQAALSAKVFDVGARLTTTGEHQRRLSENLPTVMNRGPLPGPPDGTGQRMAEPETIGKAAKSVQPNMRHNAFAAPFHHHRNRADTLHPVGALLVRDSDASTTSESQPTRASTRIGQPQPPETREGSGLGHPTVGKSTIWPTAGSLRNTTRQPKRSMPTCSSTPPKESANDRR